MVPEDVFDWVWIPLIRTLVFLRLGSITRTPSTADSGRTRVLWEEAVRRGITLEEFHPLNIGQDIFLARFGKEQRFFEDMPRPKGFHREGIDWMDDKFEMKKRFLRAEIPVARGGAARTERQALKIFRNIGKPVIAKPNPGSRSRHTTIHIETEDAFLAAFRKAKELSPWVIIEEELDGFVFRATVIGKKFVAALRREPAYVIGDGKRTVRELMELENKNPLRRGPHFHEMHTDAAAEAELKHARYRWDTVPTKDTVVLLGQKTSRGAGGGITDVTGDVHPENITLFEKIAGVVDDPLIGIDFIANSLAHSWKKEPRCGVIECNSAPFLDLHHFPLVGKPRNLAGALWDIIFPASKPRQS